MKKLMIAAAAAAMIGGAYAGDGGYAAVYNLRYMLKTIAPKTYTCGKETTYCTVCTNWSTKTSSAYYYENGTVRIDGVLAYCDPCKEVGEDYQKAVLLLWDAYNKQYIYADQSWISAMTVYDVKNCSVSNVFSKIDAVVYGKSSTKVAMDTKIQYAKKGYAVRGAAGGYTFLWTDFVWDLRATGLGSYAWGKDGGYVKSVSGNVAGLIPAFTGYAKSPAGYDQYWSGLVVDDVCAGAVKFTCDGGTVGDLTNAVTPEWDWKDEINDKEVREVTDAYVVPAYGTWTMKYNASAVTNKKGLKAQLPSYAGKWTF